MLEGSAMGKPLIATDVPGCRDVVIDCVTGFLCEAVAVAGAPDITAHGGWLAYLRSGR